MMRTNLLSHSSPSLQTGAAPNSGLNSPCGVKEPSGWGDGEPGEDQVVMLQVGSATPIRPQQQSQHTAQDGWDAAFTPHAINH